MSTDPENVRPSISSVDARVGRLEEAQSRLEARQLEQDGVMRLIQLEQTHIREIMTSRFIALEGQLTAYSTKLDNFIGRMDALISEGMKQQGDLKASPLGRQLDERLAKIESWEEVSRSFHSEVRGMTSTLRFIIGGSVAGFLVSVAALAKAMGAL